MSVNSVTDGEKMRAYSTVSEQFHQKPIKAESTETSSWKRWLLLKRRTPPPIPTESQPSRELSSNVFSRLSFIWTDPLMVVGYNRSIDSNDIPTLPNQRKVHYNIEKISEQFRLRAARGDKHALLGSLNHVFFWEYWIAACCNLLSILCLTFSPFMLRYIIRYTSDVYLGENVAIGRGVGLVIGLTLLQIISSVCVPQFFYHCSLVGGMTRACLISMIYAKSQVISARARAVGTKSNQERTSVESNGKKLPSNNKEDGAKRGPQEQGWSDGRVTNLISTDTYRIGWATPWVHLGWQTPIHITISLVMLLNNIGVSALAGFGIFLILSPLMFLAVKAMTERRKAVSEITDKRISLTQEILHGVRFVKYFAWEESFLQEVWKLRTREITATQLILGIKNLVNAIGNSLPIFGSIVSFVTYSVTHQGLEAANIFSSFALFNGLRMPLNMLPVCVAAAIDANVSLGRIQDYLLAEENPEKRIVDENLEEAFKLDKTSFTWEVSGQPLSKDHEDPKQREENASTETSTSEAITSEADSREKEPFHLDDLNLAISRNELLAVVGPVGSGKTSLLAALAGDMRMTAGSICQGGKMAYCPQSAYIQNATIQDNITFGRPYDVSWYRQVVSACALLADFDMFPEGDQTEVGERGITLSGGQKQRINIARAIYFGVDIVLLDDPLSAVDAHVGKQIFEEAIRGLLKAKCRVLATHQLHVLSQCDRILWMQNGKIDALGTFDELMTSNPAFAKMMSMTAHEEKSKAPSERSIMIEDEGDDNMEIERLVKKRSKTAQPAAVQGLMTVETKAENAISWKIYYAYIKAGGIFLMGPCLLVLLCIAASSQILSTIWLSYWTRRKYPDLSNGTYAAIYATFGVAQVLLMFSVSVCLVIGGTEASKTLLQRAMQNTLNAPMSFFDTTPLGRIVNRFSKDVDVLDNFLADSIRAYAQTLLAVSAILILVIVYYPAFVAAVVPMTGAICFGACFYRASAREVNRHEAVRRSNVFSTFGEALLGTSTIRAYGVQETARLNLESALDSMNAAYFTTFAQQAWLSLRLDIVANILMLVTTLLVVTNNFRVNPSTSAVVLSYVQQIAGLIPFIVKMLSEVENFMNSTERIYEYCVELPSEEPPEASNFKSPPLAWPEHGEIKFEQVEMRYRPGLPLVLKGMDMHVRGGERVGIIGRTGAGKSSIMSCIFRLVEISGGRIVIDDLDISKIRLQDLRSRLAIIPQDPTLFRGTVRSNLDPFNKHTDLELWTVLRRSYLVDTPSPATNSSASSSSDGPREKKDSSNTTVTEQSAGNQPKSLTLESPVAEQGLNFSLGQRQLMALSRALLRKSRIIICDEATSSIDESTDRKIQHTMQEGFKGSTVLCIAHRLRTILNYDRVVVMDQGRIAEIGTPMELWEAGGIFRGVCDKSKIRREDLTSVG